MSNLKLFKASAAALAMFTLSFEVSLAQTKAQNQQGQVQAPARPAPQKVTGFEISTLIRTTLVALHQANITGNYTVLRDLGSMPFQRLNTAVRLGQVFTRIRRAGFDLSPAVLMDAVLTKKPVIDGNGLLQLEGHVPSRPLNIMFKMAFRFEGGRWRIFSLAVGVQQPEAVALDKQPETTARKKAAPAAKTDTAKSSKTTTQP